MDPTRLTVPLLGEETTIGYLALTRREARPFEERLVAIARTLADQAVIAIENGRLYANRHDPATPPSVVRTPQPLAPGAENQARTAVTAAPAAGRLLTPREHEVAALVAEGRTNRQIAAALVIAEPTAERHLANILGKLGFHTRAQLAAWQARQAAGGPAADGAQSPT